MQIVVISFVVLVVFILLSRLAEAIQKQMRQAPPTNETAIEAFLKVIEKAQQSSPQPTPTTQPSLPARPKVLGTDKVYYDSGQNFDKGKDYDLIAQDYDKTAQDYDVTAKDYDRVAKDLDKTNFKEDAFEKHQFGEHPDATLRRSEASTEDAYLAVPHHTFILQQLKAPKAARAAFILSEILQAPKSRTRR